MSNIYIYAYIYIYVHANTSVVSITKKMSDIYIYK